LKALIYDKTKRIGEGCMSLMCASVAIDNDSAKLSDYHLKSGVTIIQSKCSLE